VTPPTVAAARSREVGVVTHYYPRVDAAVVKVGPGKLHTGDTVHFRGHTTDFYQTLDRLEVDHRQVDVAKAGQQVGVHVSHRVREGDIVMHIA
jgi:putative protease